MRWMGSFFVRYLPLLVVVVLWPLCCAAADAPCEPAAATAVSVQGAVEFRATGGGAWQQVHLNDTFCPGDEIRVLDNSRASLALANESVLRLNANSAITVQEFRNKKTSLVDMFRGAGHFFSRRSNSLEVNTPYVVAGVRGTEFLIRVEDDQTFISIFEGGVLASNEAGEVNLASGQSAIAKKGQAPVLTTVVRPRDAVQWALYYPPVVYVPPGQAEMREDLNDPVFLANRASQSLAVGRIDAAEADLQKALAIDPASADVLSLQSIVALVKNDNENAYTLAQKAVDANPQSSTAHVAMSYVQQARFDLEGARKSLMNAVAVSPDDPLAHARLAEIQLSFGKLGKALESAQKAAAIAPGLSRTQTVLGFAYLTQVKTDDARAAFEKAIQSDQADPLPRLGNGLAMIRDGQLAEGRAEIEVAASLNPNNSLTRSYLGKAFYEEKRIGLDEREFEIAKELDPNDPTPHFYNAIAKQTTNRPVEALQDMEKAIELNDNRAVYRS
ncbi:FecR domain-containing protein, partial [Desulfosarcina sp.]|uniref:FecR domain-containing protein n=1 Tax=Desulfosarcina sp. TaxID=2027861 RepID=UPI003970663C